MSNERTSRYLVDSYYLHLGVPSMIIFEDISTFPPLPPRTTPVLPLQGIVYDQATGNTFPFFGGFVL